MSVVPGRRHRYIVMLTDDEMRLIAVANALGQDAVRLLGESTVLRTALLGRIDLAKHATVDPPSPATNAPRRPAGAPQTAASRVVSEARTAGPRPTSTRAAPTPQTVENPDPTTSRTAPSL